MRLNGPNAIRRRYLGQLNAPSPIFQDRVNKYSVFEFLGQIIHFVLKKIGIRFFFHKFLVEVIFFYVNQESDVCDHFIENISQF